MGFVTYDASPAFDAALVAQRGRLPLALFSLFGSAEVGDALPRPGTYRVGPWDGGEDGSAFERAVERVRGYIEAGDVYQVNHTVRRHARFEGAAAALFRDMVEAQGGGVGAFLDCGEFAVCSASPELFFERRGTLVRSRPMKGTAARAPLARDDDAAARALVASAKERAENLMITDMVRSDVGRVAEVGSVRVSALFAVEAYPTLYQMTSTVEASSRATLSTLFAALFPPASVTGAPKIRATQIIDELESDARSIYTGCIGMVRPGGDAAFSVAIRTAIVDRTRSQLEYGVGAGIVWDSEPAAEWAEVQTKSEVLRSGAADRRLLETMLYRPRTGIWLLDNHVARLERSARVLGYDFSSSTVRHAIEREHGEEPFVLRLQLARDGTVTVERQPVPPAQSTPWEVPLVLGAVRSDDAELRHKSTRRTIYEAARQCHPDAPDVLLVNERGEATETSIGNLVCEIGGELVTPPLSSGPLPGTFRAALLDEGRIREAVVRVEDLARATACWTVNSVRGWVSIVPVFPPSGT